MQIQSSASVEPVIFHQSVKVWGFIPKFSAYEEAKGTYLEAVEEFWLDPGVRAEPHFHNTHEFFYLLEGSATVQVEKEARLCWPGDFIRISPNAVHSVRAGENGVRALAFSVSYQNPSLPAYTPAELPETKRFGLVFRGLLSVIAYRPMHSLTGLRVDCGRSRDDHR